MPALPYTKAESVRTEDHCDLVCQDLRSLQGAQRISCEQWNRATLPACMPMLGFYLELLVPRSADMCVRILTKRSGHCLMFNMPYRYKGKPWAEGVELTPMKYTSRSFGLTLSQITNAVAMSVGNT
jgi:hypothetical protein